MLHELQEIINAQDSMIVSTVHLFQVVDYEQNSIL